MTLTGYERNNFAGKDGSTITGYNVYLSRSIDPGRGAGVAVERIYLSDAKLDASGVDLADAIGKNVIIMYNKYGKPSRIVVDD